MGGFFLAFVIVDDVKMKGLRKNPVLGLIFSIIHRLWRIWPCYILCIGIYMYISSHLGDGPLWHIHKT